MNTRIWLSPPHMGGKEKEYLIEAFNTNWIAPLGPNVDRFEEDLSNYCNMKYVAALSSGTAAIHLALILLGVEKGDEVIASSFTFSATINPIVYQGATPVLIDSESDTWNMCPELLEEAIIDRLKKGKKPKAIVPVHLYGMPVKMDRILSIANQYDIPIIEDAAEALGSRFDDQPVGSFGKIAILSFNGNKIITTSGGGALLSNDKRLVARARYLATQARVKAPHYQHKEIGYNYRMSNVLAGIGRGQMDVLEQRVSQKRGVFDYYRIHLDQYSEISFQEEPDTAFYSNRWLTTMLLDSSQTDVSREDLRIALGEDDIESRPLWKPMHLQPVFSSCPSYLNGNSERLFNEGICLPSGSDLTRNEMHRVIDVISECLSNKTKH